MEKIDSEDPLAAQSWIMVENINSELKNELLEKEFSQHGKVCDIQRFAATPGAASIQYEHPSSAASAIQNADGSILAGKVLSVKAKNHLKNEATHSSEHSPTARASKQGGKDHCEDSETVRALMKADTKAGINFVGSLTKSVDPPQEDPSGEKQKLQSMRPADSPEPPRLHVQEIVENSDSPAPPTGRQLHDFCNATSLKCTNSSFAPFSSCERQKIGTLAGSSHTGVQAQSTSLVDSLLLHTGFSRDRLPLNSNNAQVLKLRAKSLMDKEILNRHCADFREIAVFLLQFLAEHPNWTCAALFHVAAEFIAKYLNVDIQRVRVNLLLELSLVTQAKDFEYSTNIPPAPTGLPWPKTD